MAKETSTISVYEYTNFIEFLKDFMEFKKKANKSFSLRSFSRSAGFASVSLMPMLLKGQRKITTDTLHKLIQALKLNKKESEYFESLVYFNQCQDDEQRDHYFEKLRKLRPKTKANEINQSQYDFFTKTFYGVIHQMVLLKDFKEDYEWIAKRIYPTIKPNEVKHAIDIMIYLNLLKRNAEGKLEHTSESITTPEEVGTFEVYQYQYNMINGSKRALVNLPPHMRDITSVMLPVPKTHIKEFKEKIASFREEMVDWINALQTPYEEVYQLNIQLYPQTIKRK
jgi:uncharacterized protein (TIGR02147 family)